MLQKIHWGALGLLWLLAGACAAQTIAPDILERQLAELAEADPHGHAKLYEALDELYQAMGYRFIWDDPVLEEQLQAAVALSPDDGLLASDYPLPSIADLLADGANGVAEAVVRRDLLWSRSFAFLLRHLYFGKADPSASHASWNLPDLRHLDDQPLLVSDALRHRDIPGLIALARPQQHFYADLKGKLAEYRDIERRGGWPPFAAQPLLKPGASAAVVPALRQRLRMVGDYADIAHADSTVYDDALVDAVKRFQQRHLLEADGIIGADTWSAFAIPVAQKIVQIRANLERMRWALKGLGGDFLLVDIAGFQLYQLSDGEVRWSSPVQVGKPYRQTPVFSSTIRYLEWNPTWTVPPTILDQDVLPAIKRDPGYLQRKNMVVLTHSGDPVDPETVAWDRYPEERFPYLLRQLPGPHNALGTVKFIFPNEHAVYMHDTPSRRLFNESSRAFSSGCIRVGKPYELAKLLLQAQSAVSDDDIANILASGETRRQHLDKPFPVVILYWTTKWTNDGGLIFAPDIYQRDQSIVLVLDQPLPLSSQRAAAL